MCLLIVAHGSRTTWGLDGCGSSCGCGTAPRLAHAITLPVGCTRFVQAGGRHRNDMAGVEDCSVSSGGFSSRSIDAFHKVGVNVIVNELRLGFSNTTRNPEGICGPATCKQRSTPHTVGQLKVSPCGECLKPPYKIACECLIGQEVIARIRHCQCQLRWHSLSCCHPPPFPGGRVRLYAARRSCEGPTLRPSGNHGSVRVSGGVGVPVLCFLGEHGGGQR